MATTLPADASKTNTDAGTDDPKQALLTDLAAIIDKFNLLKGALGAGAQLNLAANGGVESLTQAGGTPDDLAIKLATDPGLQLTAGGLITLLAAASGLQLTAGGLKFNINSLTALTSPAVADTLAVYDATAADNRRITFSNFLKVINLLTEDTTPDTAADFVVAYDASTSLAKKVLLANLATSKFGTNLRRFVADRTFAPGDVNVTTDVITEPDHPFTNGDGPYRLTSTTTLPAGSDNSTDYFCRSIASDEFALYTSRADALSDTSRVNLTSQGSGVHTITNKDFQSTTTANFTIPAGVNSVQVTIVGGGGGTGYQDDQDAGTGGGGGFLSTFLEVNPADTHLITIGKGGTRAVSIGLSGGNGGTSSFGTLASITGGVGGQGGTPGNNGVGGGKETIVDPRKLAQFEGGTGVTNSNGGGKAGGHMGDANVGTFGNQPFGGGGGGLLNTTYPGADGVVFVRW